MDTYMNKWHPWVQTRNNPKNFSPSSPHTSPAAGFIPHTTSLNADFYRCFTATSSRSIQSQGCCADSKALWNREFRSWNWPRTGDIPLTGTCLPSLFPWSLLLHLCPGERLSPGAAPSCWCTWHQPPALAHLLDLKGLLLSFVRCRDKNKPWNSNRTSHFELCFPPCSNQIWLSQETKGFQVVQAQPLKTCSKSSNLLY